MTAAKVRHSVLIVGSGDKVMDHIAELLPPSVYSPILRAGDAGEARRLLLTASVDVVIINTPLTDEFGVDLATDLTEGPVGVLLLAKSELFDQVCYKVEDSGVLTLAKPMSRQSFLGAVRLVTALSARLKIMEKQKETLQEKMKDIRVVNRAKWLLIEKKGMTEQDAHYYVEKQAMDARCSRRAAAERIISLLDTAL